MKDTSVISSEYEVLQKEVSELQGNWTEVIQGADFLPDHMAITNSSPIMIQLALAINPAQYKDIVYDFIDVLHKYHHELEESLNILKEVMTEELAAEWIGEAIICNHVYFEQFAEKHNVGAWLPIFLSENSIRPYLRIISKTYKDEINVHAVAHNGCPCCGESVRIAQLVEDGKKVVSCPRCYATWAEKKLQCSICGNDNHESLVYLQVENDTFAQVQACKECTGYVKLIDTRQMIIAQPVEILDLRTLHLDFIAQEQGYGQEEQQMKQ